MDFSEKLMYKVYAALLGTVVTIATQKALKAGWKVATGTEPPEPGDPDVPATEAFIWALASGIGIGVAQLATTRYSARHWMQVGNKPASGKTKFTIG